MAKIDVVCVHCDGTKAVVRNGKEPSGFQRYLCRDCKHSFQIEFIYNANQSGTHERIIDMAMNGAGGRETGRVLNISPNTVFRDLNILSPTSNKPSLREDQGRATL
ncbi:IS1 family transposase [Kistimonas asteriae]|uniref:IS1 family transposase n=1 Tax=Kistimonas asteriae TaxID=517724 RepID=UPI001BA5594E|nr:IS1 family transposase [Kistimonas asteriae]